MMSATRPLPFGHGLALPFEFRMALPFRYLLVGLVFIGMVTECSSVDSTPDDDDEEEGDDSSLRALADAANFYIGSAVDAEPLAQDALYSALLAREFNLLTPGNELKFGPLRPTPTTFQFTRADQILDFAEAHDMAIRGHTLVWHQQLPGWLENGNWTRESLIDALRAHIQTVVGRYKGRIAAWDVVNEPIADDGSMRESVWLDVIGPDYIDLAFRWAHEADPDARLFLNDYNTEGLGTKSDAIYALAQRLRGDGVPIHGVGLQMHVSTEFAPSVSDVAANIARLGQLGLEVHITEMDVRIPLPASSAELAQQADLYQSMLEVCLEAWNCTSFVIWGFTDRYSWVPQTFEGYGAALPFDSDYEPKFAYSALRLALENAAGSAN